MPGLLRARPGLLTAPWPGLGPGSAGGSAGALPGPQARRGPGGSGRRAWRRGRRKSRASLDAVGAASVWVPARAHSASLRRSRISVVVSRAQPEGCERRRDGAVVLQPHRERLLVVADDDGVSSAMRRRRRIAEVISLSARWWTIPGRSRCPARACGRGRRRRPPRGRRSPRRSRRDTGRSGSVVSWRPRAVVLFVSSGSGGPGPVRSDQSSDAPEHGDGVAAEPHAIAGDRDLHVPPRFDAWNAVISAVRRATPGTARGRRARSPSPDFVDPGAGREVAGHEIPAPVEARAVSMTPPSTPFSGPMSGRAAVTVASSAHSTM